MGSQIGRDLIQALKRWELSDVGSVLVDGEQFERLEGCLPADTRDVPRVDDRRVISGSVHVLKSGCRWKGAPREAIKQGSVVWRHRPGIFVVYDEPSFRAKIETLSPAEVEYELTHVFGLEDFPGCLIRPLDDGRLINHSSDPTLATNNPGPARATLEVASPRYLQSVAEALLDDRYSLVAIRDIARGEELCNDYSLEDACPPYHDALCKQYGVREDYLEVR